MKVFSSVNAYLSVIVSIFVLAFSSSAAAHVVVRPSEAVTAGFVTFTVGVPNEKDVASTAIKLLIPGNVKHVSVTSKPGWEITIEKNGEGEKSVVKSITWVGMTNPGFREDFTFSAQVPADETELQWKAYQTYADGVIVAWDLSKDAQPKKVDGSPDYSKSGPFSITKAVKETASDASLKQAQETADTAQKNARIATYVAIVSLIIALATVSLVTRKK